MSPAKDILENTEKVGSTLSSLVPQLFFDLIGRIIPGCVIIISLVAVTATQKPFPQSFLPSYNQILEAYKTCWFPLLCLSVAIVYTISIIFYGLWSCIMYICQSLLNRHSNACYDSFVEVVEACGEFSFRHDYIKLNAPIAGSRITKLKAEIHMSGSLAAAFAVCFLLTQFVLSSPSPLFLRIWFVISTIGCCLSNLHYTKRLYRSVCSYSVLLSFPEKKYNLPQK